MDLGIYATGIAPYATWQVVQIATVAGAVAAIIGAIAIFAKFKPERDALYISSVQGATTILNSAVETLEKELRREKEAHVQCRAENDRLRREIYGPRTARDQERGQKSDL